MSNAADASNNCLPSTHPVIYSVPPLPTPVRGERFSITGNVGRLFASNNLPVLVYPSHKLVVCRTLSIDQTSDDSTQSKTPPPLFPDALPVVVYRGHGGGGGSNVTAVSVARSGCYVASGDAKGGFKIWALDHVDHRSKYALATFLSGPVRDIDWDGDSTKVVVSGERSPTDKSGANAKVIQWDTGVTTGTLAIHFKGRATAGTFKPTRPYRVVTAGRDDAKVLFHAGPPFAKIPVDASSSIPTETAHTTGSVVHAVRYDPSGNIVATVGSDRAICLYDGKTGALIHRMEHVHAATIFDVAWNHNGSQLLTASGDGTCKLWQVNAASIPPLTEITTWNVALHQTKQPQASSREAKKIPTGGIQSGCTFVQGGSVPISVSFNGQLHILRHTEAGTSSCQTMTGHCAAIAACAFDANANIFYTGDTDGVVCEWDTTTCTPLRRLEKPNSTGTLNDLMHVVHTGAICGATVVGSKDRGCLLTVGWDDVMHSSSKGEMQAETGAPLGSQPSAIAAGSSKACIITVKGLLMVDAETRTPVALLSTSYDAQAVAVSSDDTTVYVGGKDCKIYIYSVQELTLTLKHTIENGHLKPIQTLALSHDGTKLASADERDVCVWDLTTSEYAPLIGRGKWCFHVQRITALAWSLNDSVLASGGADDSIYLWSLQNKMTRVHYPYAHRGGIVSLHFLPTPASAPATQVRLLSTGADSVVNLWDVSADVKAKFGN